ncbi:MAG TPA: DUF4388 domain-containing protein [Kofleriaceae bacterium]
MRALTGQITVRGDDGKRYWIAFDRGTIIAAGSPLMADSAARVALQVHLVTSSQVGELARVLAASPGRDELDVLAEAARLGTDQLDALRKRLVTQRAARTFALEHGEFVVQDEVTLSATQRSRVDVRAALYLGVKQHMSEDRLAAELRALGSTFALKPDAAEDLAKYEFSALDQPVLQALRNGATIGELEAAHRELDPRSIRGVVYALVAGQSAVASGPTQAVAPRTATGSVAPPNSAGRSSPTVPPPRQRAPSGTPNEIPEQPTHRTSQRIPRESLDEPSVARAPSRPAVGRTPSPQPPAVGRTPSPLPRAGTLPPAIARTVTPLSVSRTQTPMARSPRPPTVERVIEPRTITARRLEALIAARIALLDHGADYFALLGVPFDAPAEEIRVAYGELARYLHPENLADLGISDAGLHAARVLVAANSAIATLTDPKRRIEYVAGMRKAPELPRGRSPVTTRDEPGAAEAARRGELAMRRDEPAAASVEFSRAVELDPGNPDFAAALAWSRFAAAVDKPSIAEDTRKALERAIARSDKPIVARFYLGKVERMLGRDREALRHFHEVIDMKPNHAEAASEIRVIEARMKKR